MTVRIERLSDAGGPVSLRSFAIWCAMQCRLTRRQGRFLGDCIRALRLPIKDQPSAFMNLRDGCLAQVAGALLIGMKHDPGAATASIAVASVAHPDPIQAARLASKHARAHAAFRADSLDCVDSRAWHPMARRGLRKQGMLERSWAVAHAFGDQIDQLDRLITEAESA